MWLSSHIVSGCDASIWLSADATAVFQTGVSPCRARHFEKFIYISFQKITKKSMTKIHAKNPIQKSIPKIHSLQTFIPKNYSIKGYHSQAKFS